MLSYLVAASGEGQRENKRSIRRLCMHKQLMHALPAAAAAAAAVCCCVLLFLFLLPDTAVCCRYRCLQLLLLFADVSTAMYYC